MHHHNLRARRTAGAVLAGGLLLLGGFGLTREVEQWRVVSPDGRHVAVFTAAFYQGLIPRMPGDGASKPGRIHLLETGSGKDLGAVDVILLSAVSLNWRPTGLTVNCGGSWDFASGRLERMACQR